MRIHASLAVALAFSAALSAQSPLTTLFASNNSGSPGGVNLFDLQVTLPVTITQLDVNVITGANLAGTLDIYTCPTSYFGNETNSAAWTLVSTGNAFTTAANNTPSPCILATPFLLLPGNYGIQLKASANFGFAYTNGLGTSTPGSGSNQTWSTAELTMLCGAAENSQYTAPFTPRVWNGNLYYVIGGGNFATKSPYGTGCNTPPLTLDASARPILGTSFNLLTTQFPANSTVGASILSFIQFNPGLDLASLGMPGCRQYVGLDSSVVIVASASSASRAINLPNNPAYAGMHIYSQSAAFSTGANALGVVASNGLDLGLNVQ